MKRLILVLLFLPAAVGWGAVTHLDVAGRDVAVWKPASPPPSSGYPIVVFSHGYGGSNTQSTFLMEALANAGFLVVAPNHDDARTGWFPGRLLVNALFHRPEEPFRKESEWSETTYRDRARDIEAVLDALPATTELAKIPMDLKRIGIAGHSLGGYTALELAGAWPAWKDPRIKAVLALSPYCSPFIVKGDLRHLNVPVMYQGGTRDRGITPTVRRPGGAYHLTSAPKYFVEFDGAGHLAWTDFGHEYRTLIVRYSVAFFDRYLQDATRPDPLAPLTVKPLPKGVSAVEFQAN